MRFASLGSGSKGNATLVAAGDTLVMVDCGFSLRETRRRMERLGVCPSQLDAILVTHEHGDHSSGVGVVSRNHDVPVYLTHGTAGSGRIGPCSAEVLFNAGESFTIGDLAVEAVPVPHDAREPCQYLFRAGNRQVGLLTDLGSVTPHVIDSYTGCDGLLLEFNHDLEMLFDGDYPEALKRRVGGDWGHLNNGQAVEFLRALGPHSLRYLVVAHISENNNCPHRTRAALGDVYGTLDERVVFADQARGFDWLRLD